MSASYSLEELQSQLAAIQAALGADYTPEVYRSIWAEDIRLIIDGVDVTYFRGVVSETSGYQLTEPHAFGPANFRFPQIAALELKRLGDPNSDLKWCRKGAPAKLVAVEGGAYGEAVWKGIVASRQINSDGGLDLNCGGDLQGRLALRDMRALMFIRRLDRARLIYNEITRCGIQIHPRLGPDTGFIGDNTVGGSRVLDYVNNHLALMVKENGNQWTIARSADSRKYWIQLKDTTTVHATIFADTQGITIDVGDDIVEEPTDIYGTGIDLNGRRIINPVAPGWFRGEPPTYPFYDDRTFGEGTTNDDTDTGVGIALLHQRLTALGFISRHETGDGTYDEETSDAVKAMQKRVGIPKTGNVNVQTWNKLFNVDAVGRTNYQSEILPFAQLEATRKWDRTSNGARSEINPLWDPDRLVVDQTFDHGPNTPKRDIDKWSERYLDRIHSTENLVGTISFNHADLFAGNVSRSTAGPLTVMSRLKLREGQNIKVVWAGVGSDPGEYSLFHVSGVDVSGDTSVRAAVDTQARDLPTIGQILARKREGRRHPNREWINNYRRKEVFDNQVVFSEIGGLIDRDIELTGNKWNKVEVGTGQQGQIARIRLTCTKDPGGPINTFMATARAGTAQGAIFVCGVSELEFSPARMADIAGSDPLNLESKWHKPKTQDELKRRHLFYYTAGQAKQPLGYYPDSKVGDDGKDTNAPITGRWDDDSGFEYHTSGRDSSLYIYIFPDRDTTLRAGRVLWPAADQS